MTTQLFVKKKPKGPFAVGPKTPTRLPPTGSPLTGAGSLRAGAPAAPVSSLVEKKKDEVASFVGGR